MSKMIGNASAEDVIIDTANETGAYGVTRFKVNAIVCNKDISELQTELGYPPAKYGGPYDIYYCNGWTNWHCMSSCE